MHYELVFDDVIKKQLEKLGRNKQLRDLLSLLFDELEAKGPRAGKLLDSKFFLYEIKQKRPPLRLYFQYNNGQRDLCFRIRIEN